MADRKKREKKELDGEGEELSSPNPTSASSHQALPPNSSQLSAPNPSTFQTPPSTGALGGHRDRDSHLGREGTDLQASLVNPDLP